MVKRCAHCGLVREHGPNRARHDGLQSWCRVCLNACQLERYHRRRAEWLVGRSCAVCGGTDRLEFDHVDAAMKELNPSKHWGNEHLAQAELEKCQVLCHDHHVEKSRREGDYSRRTA